MNKKVYPQLLLVMAFILSGTMLFAQDNTLTPENNSETPAVPDAVTPQKKHNRILLIPYDPKLYMSTIDRDIADKTGLTSHQIKTRMRHGLNLNMFASSEEVMKTVSMLDSEDPEVQKDIRYIYNSIGYKYEELPVESELEEKEPEKGFQKLKGKVDRFIEKERATANEPINQPVVEPEPERYMKTTIINPNLLSYLSMRYESDVFLFINQLDISSEVDPGGYSYAKRKNKRRIKVHYTIFDVNGKEVYGGASIVYFPATVNDLNGIIKGYFPEAAATVASHLPQKVLTTAEVKRNKEMEENASRQRTEIEKY